MSHHQGATGTFSAVGQVSSTLFLRAGESVATTIQVNAGTIAIDLVRVMGQPAAAYQDVARYTGAITAQQWKNETGEDVYLALRAVSVSVGGSAAYALADVAGDQLLFERRAADGTLVMRVTDQGIFGDVYPFHGQVPDALDNSGGVFNVKDPRFGAVGDGVTDDTVAIQAAIDAANTATGGVVFFPVGVYIVSFSLQLYSAVSLIGVAPEWNVTESDSRVGSVIRVPTSATAAMAGEYVVNVSSTKWCRIQHLKIMVANSDPSLNTVGGIGDPDGAASSLIIEDNHLQWFGGPCINLQGNANFITRNRGNNNESHFLHLSGGASDNVVAFNESGAHQTNGVGEEDAIRITDGANNGIFNNHLYNHRCGVRLAGTAPSYNRIEGNRCEKAGEAGIKISAGTARGNTLLGNHLFNNGYTTGAQGIVLVGGATNTQIVGNFIFNEAAFPGTDNTDVGIQIGSGCDFNQVVGNYIRGMTNRGIYLNDSDGNLVENNQIVNTQRQAIDVEAGSNDNVVRGNYVYGTSLETNNTYDAILVNDSCDRNVVEHNTVRDAGSGNRAQYAISINTSSCDNTALRGNDVRGGFVTAAIRDVGTNTQRRGNLLTVGATSGQAALVNGTVTVSTTEVLASDNISLTRVVGAGTTRGLLAVGTIVAGTSFVIDSTDLAGTLSADDDSTVFWEIVH